MTDTISIEEAVKAVADTLDDEGCYYFSDGYRRKTSLRNGRGVIVVRDRVIIHLENGQRFSLTVEE